LSYIIKETKEIKVAAAAFFIGVNMPDVYRITVTTKSGEIHIGIINRS